MSTRIIIEKDGERYAPVDLFEHWFADDMSSIGMSNDDGEIEFAIKPLPPVIRTDNSEVIANLEAENAKLREALKPIMDAKVDKCIYRGKFHLVLDAVRRAQYVINGISRKDEDISRKGEPK